MSRSESRLVRLLGAAEDAIFPPICGGCRKRSVWLCDACWAQVRYVPSPLFCDRCGHPLQQAGDSCRWCRVWPSGLTSLRGAFVSKGIMRASIHRFKYRGEYARGRFLGRLLAEHAESTLARCKELAEIVVPVPLHVRRWRARGYNQAEILATPVAERLGLPLSHGLIRTGKTRPPGRPRAGRAMGEREERPSWRLAPAKCTAWPWRGRCSP